MILIFIIFQYLLHVLLASAPPIYYESYGANQLVRDEGDPVLTPSGKDFVSGVTKEECARVCYRQDKCKCCNSFAYRPSDQRCYLKKRAEDAIDEPYTDPSGFQTFKFFPLTSGPFYDGDLPEPIFIFGGLPFF
eukprot:TRINITY_DN1056_c0_g2_i2.p2 TRINITY_DN1056_c0_g2~~TRINITY_DN1056_c0_g2_i2.p2  ORF type:complete len:134 (+),score=3.98 TRINITY_DN1056_c0_g2_i2:177-578(+)